MPDNGVRTIDLTNLASAEDLLVHQGGTLGVLPRETLALLLAASGALADRLAELDRATSYASILRPTWTALAALAPEAIGQQAEVSPEDTGSHTDPQTSETVNNAGRYTAFGTSAGQWTWVDGGGLGSKLSISNYLGEFSGPFASTARFNIGAAGQAALDALAALVAEKAALASPALAGEPTAPTPPLGTNSTRIATTAFVRAALETLIDAAPGQLDTLNELAAALGDDPSFAATMTAALAAKAPLDSPEFTGEAKVPTPAADSNGPQIANTAFVQAVLQVLRDYAAQVDRQTTGRPDVALVQLDANKRVFNRVQPDGRHVHRHKLGSIRTDELADAAVIAALPDASEPPREDFEFIQTAGEPKRRLYGVSRGAAYGPEPSPFATRRYADLRQSADIAQGELTRRRLVTVSTAETAYYPSGAGTAYPADAVEGCFEQLPPYPASQFDLTNASGVALEFRRVQVPLDGTNYRGAWAAGSGAVPISSDPYRERIGWFWHVTSATEVLEVGDRVVLIGMMASSTAFATAAQVFILPDGRAVTRTGADASDTALAMFFRVLRGPRRRLYRGLWAATSGAYPAPANLAPGDCWAVSAAGTHDGVTYAYGDTLIRTASGWTLERTTPITSVADAASVSLTVGSGRLDEWEVRKATASGERTYLDLRVTAREPVTARVHQVGGRRQIWLHHANGTVDRLPRVNAAGNAWAPRWDGEVLSYLSDVSGEILTYRVAADRISGQFGIPGRPAPARTNSVLTVGDSYGLRWGPPLHAQIDHDDQINGRDIAREMQVVAAGSTSDHHHASFFRALSEGALPARHLLSGICCYTLDWNNGMPTERAALIRSLTAIRSVTPRFLVAGLAAGRALSWTGTEITVLAPWADDPQKAEDEALLEELMGGELFEGGNYLNMRRFITSTRSARFTASDWDPILQMTVGEVASTFGTWGLWTTVDIDDPNYPAMRTELTQARFQGFHSDVEDLPASAGEWDYYVANGTGNTSLGSVRYWRNGAWTYLGPGDGVHLPQKDGDIVTEDGDLSNIQNLMAYHCVTELSARGWLD